MAQKVLTLSAAGIVTEIIDPAGTGPSFFAYRDTTNQTITTDVFTKVQLNAELWDTANCFDPTTNYRFTPNVAGYYQISAGISTSGSGAISRLILGVWKNGSAFLSLQDFPFSVYRTSGSGLVYLNGSTDFVELSIYLSGAATLVLEKGLVTSLGYVTWMSGALVRPA